MTPRSRDISTIIWITVLAVLTPVVAKADTLWLRGTTEPARGEIVAISEVGLEWQAEIGRNQLYSWDRVRLIETSDTNLRSQFESFQPIAEKLWRARSRVEREDYLKAEVLFEDLFDQMTGRDDPTAMVAMEGLLRCQLARGARTRAVIPWLELVRMLDNGVRHDAYTRLPAVLDEATGICPDLPPLWVVESGLQRLIRTLETFDPAGNRRVDQMRQLYLAAARLQQSGGNTRLDASVATWIDDRQFMSHESVVIVAAFVIASSEKAEQREAGVRTLTRWVREPTWRGVWGRYARGTALTNSNDIEMVRDGLVDFLYIPAEMPEVNVFMSGMALARAADILDRRGREQSAQSLRTELRLVYPDHPVLRSGYLIGSSPPATTPLRSEPIG